MSISLNNNSWNSPWSQNRNGQGNTGNQANNPQFQQFKSDLSQYGLTPKTVFEQVKQTLNGQPAGSPQAFQQDLSNVLTQQDGLTSSQASTIVSALPPPPPGGQFGNTGLNNNWGNTGMNNNWGNTGVNGNWGNTGMNNNWGNTGVNGNWGNTGMPENCGCSGENNANGQGSFQQFNNSLQQDGISPNTVFNQLQQSFNGNPPTSRKEFKQDLTNVLTQQDGLSSTQAKSLVDELPKSGHHHDDGNNSSTGNSSNFQQFNNTLQQDGLTPQNVISQVKQSFNGQTPGSAQAFQNNLSNVLSQDGLSSSQVSTLMSELPPVPIPGQGGNTGIGDCGCEGNTGNNFNSSQFQQFNSDLQSDGLTPQNVFNQVQQSFNGQAPGSPQDFQNNLTNVLSQDGLSSSQVSTLMSDLPTPPGQPGVNGNTGCSPFGNTGNWNCDGNTGINGTNSNPAFQQFNNDLQSDGLNPQNVFNQVQQSFNGQAPGSPQAFQENLSNVLGQDGLSSSQISNLMTDLPTPGQTGINGNNGMPPFGNTGGNCMQPLTQQYSYTYSN